jgi:hypothetical protein
MLRNCKHMRVFHVAMFKDSTIRTSFTSVQYFRLTLQRHFWNFPYSNTQIVPLRFARN